MAFIERLSARILCLLLALGAGFAASAADGPGSAGARGAQGKAGHGIVLQVSDDNPKTWTQALNVARNLEEAYGKGNIEIEIVAFGNGIGMLKMDSVVSDRVAEATAAGVEMYACENTMRARKLHKDDMLFVRFAPFGVGRIIERQRQGWTVVRP